MKLIAAIAAFFCISVPTLAYAQHTLELTHPSIVILIDSPEEVEKNKSDTEYNEAIDDFAFYANRMIEALKKNHRFRVQWSSADRITFPGTRFKPILRRQVGDGWGYVFYRPGREPVVSEGVTVDNELVCTAVRLFHIQVNGHVCDP